MSDHSAEPQEVTLVSTRTVIRSPLREVYDPAEEIKPLILEGDPEFERLLDEDVEEAAPEVSEPHVVETTSYMVTHEAWDTMYLSRGRSGEGYGWSDDRELAIRFASLEEVRRHVIALDLLLPEMFKDLTTVRVVETTIRTTTRVLPDIPREYPADQPLMGFAPGIGWF